MSIHAFYSRTPPSDVAGLPEPPRVVLTREAGKNGKLQAMLAVRGVPALELPLVETAPGPDRAALPGMLRAGGFDWVAITSPEAAAVFMEGWRAAGCPQARCQALFRRKSTAVAEQHLVTALPPVALARQLSVRLQHHYAVATWGVCMLYGSPIHAATHGFQVWRFRLLVQ